ncbi:MAG: GNAT family N-acetyltransferase [Myxococcales bacterium]|nr:GNAT family N-acetyltransferase [Myxococcales bacterium]
MELGDGTITLRPPREPDAAAVAAAVISSHAELWPWMPWATEGYDETDALDWIRGDLDPTERAWLILGPDGELAGTCGINLVNGVNRFANLGYWLRSDRVGRGWATAAVRLVARHGHEQLDLHRLELIMSTANERSRRVAERAGARHEGVMRGRLRLHDEFHDVHLFSLLPGDLG